MITTREDISVEIFEKYFNQNKLGILQAKIPECPDCTEMRVILSDLFKHSTGEKFFKYQINPKDIVSMCVFGSTLYKHFPKTKKEVTKGIFFKKKVIYEVREAPEDVDIMVITKEGLTEDKLILPKKHMVSDSYGGWEVIDHSSVLTKRKVYVDYGCEEVIGAKNLHLVYRSVEQFLNGIGKGDTVSESVLRYGVPIIGEEAFQKVIKDKISARNALHRCEWNEDLEGVLWGEIV